MIGRTLLFLFVCTLHFASAQTGVLQSPSAFLSGQHGLRFTPHHLLVDYFRHVDEVSDNVSVTEYGKTYEMRPLIVAIVSSPRNMQRIEEIRINNLRRAGMLEGAANDDNIAIVHISYSVHGNEAAGSESSMSVLHALAAGSQQIDKWLENTVVIIDPSLNPDGYERYSHWNNSVSGQPYNANPESREHHEPWPGGRTNHYYFDLNRDWAWQTQKESQQRMAFYHTWMPHIHADVHEMTGLNSYYFAPAAIPYHPYLTSWQADFQKDIGRHHAGYFDKNGWRYFTKERFDLFYPSYGDTYPMLSGAIGMTYEQSGHAAAGRAISTGYDTLRLKDRIDHHFTTSMSTIEVASKNAAEIVKEFSSYFQNAVHKPAGHYKSYVIKSTNHPGKIRDILTLLDRNGIRYGMMHDNGRSVRGYSYQTGSYLSFAPQQGDIVIPVRQSRSALLNALFEPEAALADSMTYDITAWSIPMAYGLTTFATEEILEYGMYQAPDAAILEKNTSPYAYAFQWGSVPSARLLAELLSKGIRARYATEDFKINGIQYRSGTILVLRADNRNMAGFDGLLQDHFAKTVVPVSLISTGFVETGKDLGSESYRLIRTPNALSVAGQGVSSLSIGQVWHFFEEELGYPIHLIEPERLDDVRLTDYNVIILPEGSYSLSNDLLQKITAWMRAGGQLVVIGSAVKYFAGKDGFALKSKSNNQEMHAVPEEPVHYPEAYNAGERRSLSGEISGAVFKTKMDTTHPLSFGLGEIYWTLKTNASSYGWLPAGGNAIYLDDKPKYHGFAGRKAVDKVGRTIVAANESIGQGGVVYFIDNPLFRSFWNNGKVLFSNALFF